MPSASMITPLGGFGLIERGGAIVEAYWCDREEAPATPLLTSAMQQLKAYFDGSLRQFGLPLAPGGGPFQQAVCTALLAIPYGRTKTYGEIARDLGSYGQPVGAACGRNPIPLLIPCHRVLSAQGLGGFSARGGVETKIALLQHEGAYPFLF
ncbi:MAG: methylated-DNA--[protein]-cysteine S-methyltransferase [Rhodospirillales bacterium]|nr:methylated-DNA--[protein]-cysteine S-methyltransferase [Rhodospirillales bacterium]